VARALRDHGLEAVVVEGGLQAWKRAGQPVEKVPREDIVQLPKFAR
jgi:rhodanese-related sulfurtransferase